MSNQKKIKRQFRRYSFRIDALVSSVDRILCIEWMSMLKKFNENRACCLKLIRKCVRELFKENPTTDISSDAQELLSMRSKKRMIESFATGAPISPVGASLGELSPNF